MDATVTRLCWVELIERDQTDLVILCRNCQARRAEFTTVLALTGYAVTKGDRCCDCRAADSRWVQPGPQLPKLPPKSPPF